MFRCCDPCGFTTEETTSVKNQASLITDADGNLIGGIGNDGKTLITHNGYKSGDLAQQVVQYAYEYTSGDMDFIYMMECESGMKPTNKGDSGKAYGLCQMNSNYHKIPQEYYDDWKYQVEYCYEKYKGGTKFYGPSRKTKATNYMRCSDYVKSRFVLDE